MPLGSHHTISGTTLQCYTFEEYKSIVLTFIERNKLLTKTAALEEKNKLVIEVNDLLKKVVKINEAKVTILQDENSRLSSLWKEENRKRHLAEEKPRIGSYVAWGLAGAFAVSTLTLMAVVATD